MDENKNYDQVLDIIKTNLIPKQYEGYLIGSIIKNSIGVITKKRAKKIRKLFHNIIWWIWIPIWRTIRGQQPYP